MTRCDVVMTSSDSVLINGNMIGKVTDIEVRRTPGAPTELVLTINPDSIMFGDIPRENIEALMDGHPDDDSVDISKAITRAKARAAGIPMVKTPIAPNPIPAPRTKKKVVPIKVDNDLQPDSPAFCPLRDDCSRPPGHSGDCHQWP